MQQQRPLSKHDIRDTLVGLRGAGLEFWRSFDPERFWSVGVGVWSPADNVRHLTMATLPVFQALRMPWLVLRLLFGVAREPSQARDVLRARYQDELARGAKAGRFTPRPGRLPVRLGEEQQRLIDQCAESLGRLEKAMAPWSETQLDQYRLPHPVLGRVTVREMLMFTLFHFEHHRDTVSRRRGLPLTQRES